MDHSTTPRWMRFPLDCPHCCQTTLIKSQGDDGKPCWECTECSRTWARRAPAKVPTAPNKRQLAVVKALVSQALDGTYEVKTQETRMSGRQTLLYLIVGCVGDEGTLAEALCRSIYHITIGPRGAVRPVYWTGPKCHEPKTVFSVINTGTDWNRCYLNPVNLRSRSRA